MGAVMQPTDFQSANAQQRRKLLEQAPIKDIEDLIPVLVARVRETGEAFRKAQDELAEALSWSEVKKEVASRGQ